MHEIGVALGKEWENVSVLLGLASTSKGTHLRSKF